jgi:hypothetical protein
MTHKSATQPNAVAIMIAATRLFRSRPAFRAQLYLSS